MKPGDLERNLVHLFEVAKAAEARLASAELEVSAIRLALDAEVPELSGVSGSERPGAAGEAVSMEAAYK